MQRVETFPGAACFRAHLGGKSVGTKYYEAVFNALKRLPSSHTRRLSTARGHASPRS
jgi:hypothetical protein